MNYLKHSEKPTSHWYTKSVWKSYVQNRKNYIGTLESEKFNLKNQKKHDKN